MQSEYTLLIHYHTAYTGYVSRLVLCIMQLFLKHTTASRSLDSYHRYILIVGNQTLRLHTPTQRCIYSYQKAYPI